MISNNDPPMMPFGPPPFPRFPLVSPSKPMVFPNESPPSQASVARCPSLAPAAVKPLGWQRCPWGSRDTAPWFGAHLAEGKAWGFRDGRLMMFDDRCTIYIYQYIYIYNYIYIYYMYMVYYGYILYMYMVYYGYTIDIPYLLHLLK